MLKTNNKKVREAVRAYVTKNTNGWDEDPKTFEEAAAILKKTWDEYKYPNLEIIFKHNIFEAFRDWATGLPNNVFNYFAEGDTVKLVGDMLEQTEAQRSKYDDGQACDLLTLFIFREVDKAVGINF